MDADLQAELERVNSVKFNWKRELCRCGMVGTAAMFCVALLLSTDIGLIPIVTCVVTMVTVAWMSERESEVVPHLSNKGRVVMVADCEYDMASMLVKHLDRLGTTVIAVYKDPENSRVKHLQQTCSQHTHFIQSVSQENGLSAHMDSILTETQNKGIWALVDFQTCSSVDIMSAWLHHQRSLCDYTTFTESVEKCLVGLHAVVRQTLSLVRKSAGRVIVVTPDIRTSVRDSSHRMFDNPLLASVQCYVRTLRTEQKRLDTDTDIVNVRIPCRTGLTDTKSQESALTRKSDLFVEAAVDAIFSVEPEPVYKVVDVSVFSQLLNFVWTILPSSRNCYQHTQSDGTDSRKDKTS